MSAVTVEREWQEYDGFKVEFLPSSHRYYLHTPTQEHLLAGVLVEGAGSPERDWDRIPAISVTSALSVLNKPALIKWAGKEDATAVLGLERDGQLMGIPTDQAIYVARQRGYGAEAKRDAGAARGTAVHKALQDYVQDGMIPKLDGLSDEVRGYVQALASWLIDASPEPVMSERIVGSPKYGFAGRFDLIASLSVVGGKWNAVPTLVDLKTGANAHKYPEAHIQLAGYELAFGECGIEPIGQSMIVSLDESGFYKTATGLARREDFLAVLDAHRAVKSIEKALRASEKG